MCIIYYYVLVVCSPVLEGLPFRFLPAVPSLPLRCQQLAAPFKLTVESRSAAPCLDRLSDNFYGFKKKKKIGRSCLKVMC